MGHFPQVLEGVALGGDGIGVGIVDPAEHSDGVRLHLDVLPAPLGFHQLALGDDGAAGGEMQDLGLVSVQGLVGDHLDGVEAGSVVQVDE